MDGLNNTWNTDKAVHRLSPEIYAASARLKRRRAEHLQMLGFALAALAFLGACALTILYRKPVYLLGGGALLTLLLAPVLVYFKEEEKSHEI